MILMIVTACMLSSSPPSCAEWRTPYYNMTMTECTTSGHLLLPAWSEEHEGWSILKWRCEYPESGEEM